MWDNLKASIASVVRTNNNQEITGANLQNVLNTIVNSVGANATFAGIAIPSTNPGTPDGPVFWLVGQAGQYSNFNNTTVPDGVIGIFVFDGNTWTFTIVAEMALSADKVSYDNSQVGFAAIDVQAALDEIANILFDIQREDTPEIIDLSSHRVRAWIGANGNFSVTAGQECAIIPTNGYKKLSITSNANNNCFFLLLKTYPTIAASTPYSPYLCNGETGRRTQEAGTTKVYNLPNDCTYVMIGITSTSNAPEAYKPSSASFLGGRIISRTDRIERLEEATFYQPPSEYTAINIKQSGSQIQAWLNSTGKWSINNTQSSYVVDVRNYRNLRITSNSDYSTIFAFCRRLPVVPTTSTSYTTYLCSGETGRRTQAAGTTVEYTLPSDCQYIVVGDKSTTMAGTYLPDLFELAYDSDTLLPIINLLEAEISKIDTDLHTVKILSIGNSFSRDALSYAPMILKELGINATIGILYHSTCSLQMHWENRESANYYTFDYFDWANSKWKQTSSVGLNYGLSYADWDIVTFQQNSANSMNYATYQPYLDNLISYVSERLQNIKTGWLLTHAWADGYSGLSSRGITSDEMAELVRTAAKSVINNTGIDVLIPYGTAVQLARGNENLAQLGTAGGMSYDGIHLQEGIGCLIAAYTCTKVISELLYAKAGIHGSALEPNASFLSTYAIPEQHGTCVGITDENKLLGQKYAIIACNNPLQES